MEEVEKLVSWAPLMPVPGRCPSPPTPMPSSGDRPLPTLASSSYTPPLGVPFLPLVAPPSGWWSVVFLAIITAPVHQGATGGVCRGCGPLPGHPVVLVQH